MKTSLSVAKSTAGSTSPSRLGESESFLTSSKVPTAIPLGYIPPRPDVSLYYKFIYDTALPEATIGRRLMCFFGFRPKA